jgi:hypothetical protein
VEAEGPLRPKSARCNPSHPVAAIASQFAGFRFNFAYSLTTATTSSTRFLIFSPFRAANLPDRCFIEFARPPRHCFNPDNWL